jgi:ubiquitin-like protein Pup
VLWLNPREVSGSKEEARMVKQERQQPRRESRGVEEAKPNPKIIETGRKMTQGIDKLVDEIDDVLEANAEEFVRSFVQKGGE